MRTPTPAPIGFPALSSPGKEPLHTVEGGFSSLVATLAGLVFLFMWKRGRQKGCSRKKERQKIPPVWA